MRIIIDISEDLYLAVRNGLDADEIWDLRVAVTNGAPLPKGHGDLIDKSALVPDADYEDGMCHAYSREQIDGATTIIEEDRSDKE